MCMTIFSEFVIYGFDWILCVVFGAEIFELHCTCLL